MLSLTPKQATLASESQLLPVGFDGGNGSAKLVFDLTEIRCPAYFLPIHTQLYDVPASINGGLVEYIDGDRKDLQTKVWLAGHPAYQQHPTGCLRTVDDRRGKLLYGLQMLLGGMATLKHQNSWKLLLIASIQDAQAFGDELKQLLRGKHRVKFNGRNESIVEIQVSQVVEEGVGAIVTARPHLDPNGQTLLYDFGSGTCIISVFGPKGKLIDRKVSPGGVESLIDAIATNLKTRKQLSAEGDRQIIRAGIEDGTFNYGRSGWNFKPVYQEELAPWVQSVLSPALKAASPWTPTSSAILAVGGGSQLPTITELLIKRGIFPIEDGCWANARGLARIAHLKRSAANE